MRYVWMLIARFAFERVIGLCFGDIVAGHFGEDALVD